MDLKNLIACPACDLLHRKSELPMGMKAYCSRCKTPLYSGHPPSLDRPLAFVLCGLIVFAVANVAPFLTLKMEGRTEETVLVSGILSLYQQGRLGLAGLVLLTGIIFPLAQLAGLSYVLLLLRVGMVPSHLAVVYRWVRSIQPWAMIEIFMLGTLVSVIKLANMAGIVPGIALYAFMALVFIVPAATAGLHPESIWERIPIHTR